MSPFQIDTLKAEKADALRRFYRNRNFSFCLQFVGALSFLCSSFKCFPTIANTIASTHPSVLNQQLYAFVLINTIFLFVFQLSNNTKNNHITSKKETAFEPDLYDEYVLFSTIFASSSFPGRQSKTTSADEQEQFVVWYPVPEEIPISKEDGACKEIARCGENVVDNHVEKNTNPARDIMAKDYDYAIKMGDRGYRRSWSEKGHRERRNGGRELRCSETVAEPEPVVNGGDDDDNNGPGRKSVQEMDNEEFNLTIEKYIASTKQSLRDERLALLSVERTEHMAVTFK